MTYLNTKSDANSSRHSIIPDTETDPVAALLAVYPDLARITDPTWLSTIYSATHHHFEARTVLLCGTSPINKFMLVLEGSARVYYPAPDGREITLYRINPGDLCILSLNGQLQNRYFNVVVQADSAVHALGISVSNFHAALAASEDFRTYVLSTLNGRLCDLMCLVQDTAFHSLSVRLACLLGQLFERTKSNILHITHLELAHELGTTREAVSRSLKEFEQLGYIRLSRAQITVSEHCNFPGLSKSQ